MSLSTWQAQLIVRNLDEDIKAKLQMRAKRHGRSTEEEVRDILRSAANEPEQTEKGLGTRIAEIFSGDGLLEGEDIPELRGYPSQPADFGK